MTDTLAAELPTHGASNLHGPQPRDSGAGLTWRSEWVATPSGASAVVLSAGADRQFELDGLSGSDRERLLGWANGDACRPSDAVVAHLVEIGAAAPVIGASRRLTAEVLGTAPSVESVVARLRSSVTAAAGWTVAHRHDGGSGTEQPDLLVLVRAGQQPLPNKIDACASPRPWADRTRLIVDVGAARSFVVGPFVVPGRSACDECLDRLLARRWEAVAQPPAPGVLDSIDLVVAAVGRHLALIARGRSPVINNTIVMDAESMCAERQPLLMSVACATCQRAELSARPELGWSTASRSEEASP